MYWLVAAPRNIFILMMPTAYNWRARNNLKLKLFIKPEIAHDQAIFPDAQHRANLEMLRDLDRTHRRILSRMWTEIKLR